MAPVVGITAYVEQARWGAWDTPAVLLPADLDPGLYGEAGHPETRDVDEVRDAGELALLREALARDLPVLGICRGIELLVVASGGRLYQHLPDVVGHDRHRPARGEFGSHDVRVQPGTRVAAAVGERLTVASHHHQGIADPGALSPVAWSDDGAIEAVEAADRRFVVGVLWHPEARADARLFAALCAAAAVRAA
jgi:putative glutamine amidotransferase